MSTSSSIAVSLLAVVMLALGYTFSRERTTQQQQLHDQVAQLQRQMNQLATTTSVDIAPQEHRFLPTKEQKKNKTKLSLSCACETPSGFTYASDFGVIGDATADDTLALQAAIDSASANDSGGIVVIPKGTFRIFEPLIVPAGVTLQGQGYGDSPLAISFDAGASTIAYCGTDYAVKLAGHAAGLRDLAVYDWPYGTDCENIQAAGGVLVEADAALVESVIVSNIFIYFFLGGPALSLVAKNSAGIAFGNYQNVRIRHAKQGISLQAEESSFVNSNSFLAGGMSGGGFEVGVIAQGPGACNDNKFYGMFIEPPDTTLTHVYVSGAKTNVKFHDVRLEATSKSLDKPIVIIDDSSYGNVMNGLLGHTHVQANLNRNPDIDLMSAKSVGMDPAPKNLYWNSAFKGYNADDRMMPGFSLVGTNAAITILEDSDEMLFPDHNVIDVDYLNYGGAFKLMADITPKAPAHDFVTFGVYARSSVPGSISGAMRYESGNIISSASHSGGGDWEFIGMTALYDKSAPYFYFSITGDVQLTAPTFIYGKTPAIPGASLMSSSGARMSGTLTMGVTTVYPPPDATQYYWVIPKNSGNIFLIDTQGNPSRSIIRLNHRTADRFARGTLATLMFEEAGTRVKHNSYIKLKNNADFVSGPNTSITLMAGGSASWVEVSRNE
mmetsp:Transcript_24924/g.49813  ORF Transcript_24924/g.49813 Transcript_24924/m.49813 type:complete len:667 (+) Transcript_24924:61-2061(+)